MELWQAIFETVNLPWTILLGILLLYWGSVILGALDISMFDLDLDTGVDMDADVDVDVDADLDADTDVDGAAGDGALIGFLRFLNIGELPVMIVLSFFVLSAWTISILGNYYLNPNYNVVIGAGLAVPTFIVSLFVARFLGLPFRALFRKLESDKEHHVKVVGQTCTIKTSEVTPKFGQAEITTNASPITLNVWAREDENLVKGDQALIVEFDKERDAYKVVKFELEV